MEKASSLSRGGSASRFGLVDLALIGMTLIWGSNFVILKLTFLQIAPMAFMTLRFAIASSLLIMLLRARESATLTWRSDYGPLAVAGFVGTTLYQVLFINGVSLTTASNSSLILASTPAFIALINRGLGRERLDARGWSGIGLAFLGILLIVQSSGGIELGSLTLTGDLLILLATFCWSLYSVLSAPLLRTQSSLRVTAISTALGTIPLLLIGAPALIEQDWLRVNWQGWGGLIFSAVFAIAIAYVIWNLGVRRIGGARTAIYNNLTPVVASITAALLLGEAITLFKILGACVIFLGLYLARTGNLVMEPEG